ncbi:hypothetical protein ACVWWO_001902 [Bradyrhizobium sp. F1.13.1]
MADPSRAELIQFQHGPMRKQQHQPRTLQPVHQESQRFKRYSIGPVQILDNDQERRQDQAPFEHGTNRKEYLPPKLLGLDVLQRGVRIAEAENVEIKGHQAIGLFDRKAELRQCRGQLGLGLRHGRLLRDAVGAAQHSGKGAIGLFAQRRADSAPDRHAGETVLIVGVGNEFVHQTRFADAGFTDQPHQLRRAATREIKIVD